MPPRGDGARASLRVGAAKYRQPLQRVHGPRARTGCPHFVHTSLTPQRGSAWLGQIGLVSGGITMTDWKADLDALIDETMAFAKRIHVAPLPRTIVEPNRMPSV